MNDIDQPEGVFVCRFAKQVQPFVLTCKHGGQWRFDIASGGQWTEDASCPNEQRIQREQRQEDLENMPEWEEGAHAHSAGMNQDANPYFKIAGGKDAFEAWDLGWKQTRKGCGI